MKKLSIRQKFIGMVVVIVLLVAIVGISTYRQLTNVVDVIQENTAPDRRYSLAKNILYNLSQSENAVKSYSLTLDSSYYYNYNDYRSRVEEDLRTLHEGGKVNKRIDQKLDSLHALVNEKYIILKQLLLTQNEFRVEEALDKIEVKIGSTIPQESKKDTKVKRGLFGRKKEEKSSEASQNEINQLNKEVAQIKSSEIKRENDQLTEELELLRKDNEIRQSMQRILDDLEKIDANRLRENAAKISGAVSATNMRILVFVVIMCLLLIYLSTLILRYISTNNKYRKVLRKAKREAEALANAKEQFVATVSHEIRTPVNIIAGFAEQLEDSDLNKTQREHLSAISSASSHLLQLINDVLDFTRIHSGKLAIENKTFKLDQAIEEVTDSLHPLIEKKKLSISVTLDEDIPAHVSGDAFRLRQVLFNVIGNAIKFTNEGGISVHAGTVLSDAQSVRLFIEVEDSGIGMTKAQLERVFHAFEQADASTTRQFGGTGLGLSITKDLLTLQGGTIDLVSKPGLGTSVRIEIPYLISDESRLQQDKELEFHNHILQSKTVLIVDDEAFNRQLVASILKKHGATVGEAKNGKEAVKEASNLRYDLILMDSNMPEMNGVDAAKNIAKLYGTSDSIPIIALTAAVSAESKENYKKAGMSDFVPKPFREEQLMIAVLRALKIESDFVETKVKASSGLNFDALKELAGSDKTFYQNMLETFIDGTKSGVQELKEALNKKDISKIKLIAHRIASPCGHIGAEKLYASLKSIENENHELDELESLIQRTEELTQECIIAVQDELSK